MKFVFTKHAKGKFRELSKQGIKITIKDVLDSLRIPDHVDKQIDFPKAISSKKITDKLVLRVVFKKEDDIIIVITFYPARKGRYYETN